MKSFLRIVLLSLLPCYLYAQQVSIIPNFSINTMFGLSEYPNGVGVGFDIDYRPKKMDFLSIALRAKYNYFNYDDNSKIVIKDDVMNDFNRNPKLLYEISLPQLAVVPKLYYEVYDNFSLYFESEFAYGIIYVKSRYLQDVESQSFTRKNFRRYQFTFTPSIGGSLKCGSVDAILAIGWDFINFTKMLEQHEPSNYLYRISDQVPGMRFSFLLRVPLF